VIIEHLEKRSGERNVDNRFQVQLEEAKDRPGWRQVVYDLILYYWE